MFIGMTSFVAEGVQHVRRIEKSPLATREQFRIFDFILYGNESYHLVAGTKANHLSLFQR